MDLWKVVVCDLAGQARAFPQVEFQAISRLREGGVSEVTFELPTEHEAARELAVGSRSVKVFLHRDGATAGSIVFRGRVWQPLVTNRRTVRVTARSPWADLQERKLTGELTSTDDRCELAWDLVDDANVARTTRVRRGVIGTSSAATRTWAEGTAYAEALVALMEESGGVWPKLRPLDNETGVWAELDVDDVSGSTRDAIRFECGAGTLANCKDFTEELMLPRNRVRVTGQPDAAGVKPEQLASDAASINEYDLFAGELAVSDVDEAATLLARAQGALVPTPPAVYTFEPHANAPVLIRDFAIGDLVAGRINHGRVDVELVGRAVEGITTVSKSGVARTSSLLLADQAVRRLPRPPSDRVEQLYELFLRRLAILERSPFRGA